MYVDKNNISVFIYKIVFFLNSYLSLDKKRKVINSVNIGNKKNLLNTILVSCKKHYLSQKPHKGVVLSFESYIIIIIIIISKKVY